LITAPACYDRARARDNVQNVGQPAEEAMKPDELASHDGMGLAGLVRRSAIQILNAAVASVETRRVARSG
jgi:hypothetical protein